MILIADSGSTKTNWCLLHADGKPYFFDTEGYNPYFVDPAYIVKSLGASLPGDVDPAEIGELFFYGAGCFEDKAPIVSTAMAALFPNAATQVHLDLLASARALLGNEPGFVAILGTGTNSCLYDGDRITLNIDSLGFLLGDEGSGAWLGKRLLADFIRGYMPAAVRQEFVARFGVTRETIMETVYAEAMPNRFCASFTPFLLESATGVDYSRELVRQGFRDFFDGIVCHYPDFTRYSFNCIGSVADSFREILGEVAFSYGMAVGTILRSPIAALAEYHSRGK
jgi:glucosamine kinase